MDPLTADCARSTRCACCSPTNPSAAWSSSSRPAPNLLRLTTPASVDPRLVTEALQRVSTTSTAARGFLVPVGSWTVNGRNVDLQLKGPAPDLERMLCHPAFAIPVGAFRARGTRLEAFDEQPAGRPHLDAVVLQSADARTAERLFAQRRVQLVVGASSPDEVVQLFATAVVLGPGLSGLRAAVESTTDRGDLARFFVAAPAGPLPGLLPPSLAPPAPRHRRRPTRAARPAPRALPALRRGGRPREEHRPAAPGEAAAARATASPSSPRPRAQLRGRSPAEGEVFLRSRSPCPPRPPGALVLWLELAGQHARIPAVLQLLAAAPDLDARARELATQLGPELPLIPLVTRGLGVAAAGDVQHLTRDALGLPRLDDVFFSAE